MRTIHLNRRTIGRVLDVVWLVGLALYVIAGRDKVPFHGDESTHIYMSRDYYHLVQQRDLDAVRYSESPPDDRTDMDQHLRLVNGTVFKLAVGFAWDMAGLTVDDLNGPWDWWGTEGEWAENVRQQHLPSDRLLRIARTVSTLFTVISVLAVYGIARHVTGSRPATWAASLIYTTTPAVLLNGRRAMTEGALLCFSALVILVALIIIRAQAQHRGGRTLAAWYVLLGITGGLAVASKHSGIMAVGVAFLVVTVEPLFRHSHDQAQRRGVWPYALPSTTAADSPLPHEGYCWRIRHMSGLVGALLAAPFRQVARRLTWPHLRRVSGAGALVIVTFLALNPMWWAGQAELEGPEDLWDGRHMPARVLEQRRDLLDGQVAAFGGYDHLSDRTTGLLEQAFFARPQYYEVPVWQQFVGDEIDAYRASGLAGRSGGDVWGVLLVVVFVFGLVELWDRRRDGPAWTVLIWMSVTALLLLILTPLSWQRYYLPLQAPVAVVAGVGIGRIGTYTRAAWNVRFGRLEDTHD